MAGDGAKCMRLGQSPVQNPGFGAKSMRFDIKKVLWVASKILSPGRALVRLCCQFFNCIPYFSPFIPLSFVTNCFICLNGSIGQISGSNRVKDVTVYHGKRGRRTPFSLGVNFTFQEELLSGCPSLNPCHPQLRALLNLSVLLFFHLLVTQFLLLWPRIIRIL